VSNIEKYLRSCRELSEFCSQNGWIDNSTLILEVLFENDRKAIVDVRFEEIIMEGSGCVAARIPCWGKMVLELDKCGRVIRSRLI